MANLRSRRPRLDPEAFIAAAESGPMTEPAIVATSRPEMKVASKRLAHTRGNSSGRGEVKPWEHPAVRADVTKAFNLRLPEPLKLKLDFIRNRTRMSVHEFIMTALVPAVDVEIERLEGKRK